MWETQKNDGTEREAQEGGGSRVGGVPVANCGGGSMVGSKIERKRREQILLQVSQSQRRGSVNQRETGCDVRVVKLRRWEQGGQSQGESRGTILRLPVLLCLSVRQRRTPAGGERECRAALLPLLANQHPTVPELSFFFARTALRIKSCWHRPPGLPAIWNDIFASPFTPHWGIMASSCCQRWVRERVQHYPRNLAEVNKQINKQFVSLGYCISLGCKGPSQALDKSRGETRACLIGQAAGEKVD